ncbi:MAG: hypothetical protein N2C14_02235, partial [Planctomycetales bacterium]
MMYRLKTTATCIAALSFLAALPLQAQNPPSQAAQVQFFEQEVKSILVSRCLKCHSGNKPKGELLLTDRASVLKGGESGAAVDLKKLSGSLLLEAINHDGVEMPPKKKLPQEEIDVLTRWVKAGIPWTAGEQGVLVPEPDGPQVNERTMAFWSFQQ